MARAHDIGLRMVKRQGAVRFEVIVGGGLGRTPMIGKVISEFITPADLLPYLEAIVSVWNLHGRRDNKYKARIKITVHEHGIDKISALVEERFALLRDSFQGHDQQLLEHIRQGFARPEFKTAPLLAFERHYDLNRVFRDWIDTNIHPHRNDEYAIVSISLKTPGKTPGDASTEQMRVMADIAERYGHNELRVSHEQNLILPHVHKSDLQAVHKAVRNAGLATANIGLISDIIACPGMDYCALATARSIPIAQEIATHFDALKAEHDIGDLKLKISGCINACGHHHIGHIGILGLDRAGVESYQITLGGDATETAAIGDRAGPGFAADEIVPAIDRLVTAYLQLRTDKSKAFLQTYRRGGLAPFKTALYPETTRAGQASAAQIPYCMG